MFRVATPFRFESKIFLEGKAAFASGNNSRSCPYTGPMREEWLDGFDAAFTKRMEEERENRFQDRIKEVRRIAKLRHEKERKAAAKRGRKDFPMSPYECSWAFEMQMRREG